MRAGRIESVLIGIDVGSTTVKCVAIDPDTTKILWCRYVRHEARQAEKVADMLSEIETSFSHLHGKNIQAFITGSGASPLASVVGARFVQEVNAVTLAVEKLHPEVNSVVELGGQDAKMILFRNHPDSAERQIITSMNDKCASGTGATIDKCFLKVAMPKDEIAKLQFDSGKIHHVAAKCGVFAETDIVNLIKAGIPASEVINSLADAIVMQNLSVLTRGNTLHSNVLLLGGPNTYLPFLQQCWRMRIPQIWQERGYQAPNKSIDELIQVPKNGQYYAAFGAVVFGKQEGGSPDYRGSAGLSEFIKRGRKATLSKTADLPLTKSQQSLKDFSDKFKLPKFNNATFSHNQHIRGYIGLDGGSTSSKAVLIDENGDILNKQYQLSRGNPIKDTKEILIRIANFVNEQNSTIDILGFGATGYAADVLEKATRCDANIVETVAHMMSAKRYCGDDIDVICDIGGQDIKVLFLHNGVIKNFRLSNQCSAGNGMLLQAMADQFGVDIKDYADIAFQAQMSPKFSYGCAVFLDSDRVNFQKEGYSRDELFAGLAKVLPKNIWQYVVQIPRMAELGKKYVLQGGTQYNLAAVKSQFDYIKARVPDAQIILHPHCGEAGAIGAALEAKRVVERRGYSSFIGLDATINLHYTSKTDESTRCHFCDNHCSRTFIDTKTPNGEISRYIAGFSCEKGTVESKQAVINLNKERKRLKSLYPNLVDYEATYAFRRVYKPEPNPSQFTEVEHDLYRRNLFGYGLLQRKRIKRPYQASNPDNFESRKNVRIGIPRVLNMYSLAPFLRAYLESLGIAPRNIVFSDQTSEELWLEGGKYGSIDPCYPAKVTLAHIHNLLNSKQRHKNLNYVWFPCLTQIPTFITNTSASTTCPIVAGTPEVAAAAFTKEKDYFKAHAIEYISNALNFCNLPLLRKQLFASWGTHLKITEDENDFACGQGLRALELFDTELQHRGMQILTEAEQNDSVVLLMLGRPYHNDPGLNHEILDEFQSLGYPVLSIRSIPKEPAYLKRFFMHDLNQGTIKDVFDIRDVWPENYSTNSVQKVWAAKFAARHPNVAVIDLSSFKCGHDAPTYGLIDKIIENSNTPYSALHDLDANKPSGSIKIRVKTYAYTLSLFKEHLQDKSKVQSVLERNLASKRKELMRHWFKQQTKLFTNLTQTHDIEKTFQAYVNDEERSSETESRPAKDTVAVSFQKNPLEVRDAMAHQQGCQLQESADELEQERKRAAG